MDGFTSSLVESRNDLPSAHPDDPHYVDRMSWLRAAVMGANDGIVSVGGLITGVAAASPDPKTILIAGSAGLVPRSWHPALEAWGATQFQNRFEELAHRRMWEEDYQTWLALRMIGEAATRAQSTDPAALRDFMLSPNFEIAGFKGQKLTLRDWDHQLRQPILLTTGDVTASVSPQDQYLHQSSALDTLGVDRPETECKF